jgi:hypothetical protein
MVCRSSWSNERISSSLKPSDERLGFGLASYGDRQIRVSGEARLTPDDDRQPADDGPLLSLAVELGLDSAQNRFEGGHRDGRGQSTGRPTQSPCSAPGRSWSHCARRAAISCSSASGKRRRRFCRIIPTPASKRSRAVRKRRAATIGSMPSFYSPCGYARKTLAPPTSTAPPPRSGRRRGRPPAGGTRPVRGTAGRPAGRRWRSPSTVPPRPRH